jgi:hypothetical protein
LISVLLATTGRPDMAERCARTLFDTTEGHRVELVAAVDKDRETCERLLAIGGWSQERRLIVDESQHMRGCSKAWNDALRASTGDPVVLAADDLEWHSGWPEAALAKLSEFPDGWGMVGFNDGHWREDLSTHYLMSRRFIVEVLGGRVAWECYKHSFNDSEANERAKRAGRYAWCEDAHVHHQHWLFGQRPQDPTDIRWLGAHAESQQKYLERLNAGFPDELEPIISC